MRFLLLFALLCLVLFNGQAWSQTPTRVVPAICTAEEGDCNDKWLLSYETSRHQTLFRSGALTGKGGVIFSVSYRRDIMQHRTQTFAAWGQPFYLDAYITSVTPETMSTTFATNRGSGQAMTLFNGTLNLPAALHLPIFPAPWTVHIPFIAPFPFVVSQGNLLFEACRKGPGTAHKLWSVDADARHRKPSGWMSYSNAMACTGQGGEILHISGRADSWIPGGAANVVQRKWGGTLPANIVTWIGDSNTRWGPLKLPFDLASLGGTASGVYPCTIYANWLADQVVPTGANFAWGPIPMDPILVGVTIYSQALAAKSGVNPLGIITANGFSMTIGSGNPPLADLQIMFNTSSYTNPIGKTYASTVYTGPVTRFTGAFN